MTIHDPATAASACTIEVLLANLPPRDTTRWVASRKAAVVNAVNANALSAEDAMVRYNLTNDELDEWRSALGAHGARGLLVTKARLRPA